MERSNSKCDKCNRPRSLSNCTIFQKVHYTDHTDICLDEKSHRRGSGKILQRNHENNRRWKQLLQISDRWFQYQRGREKNQEQVMGTQGMKTEVGEEEDV